MATVPDKSGNTPFVDKHILEPSEMTHNAAIDNKKFPGVPSANPNYIPRIV